MIRMSAWTVALVFGGLMAGCSSPEQKEISVVPGTVPECGEPEILVLGWEDTLRTDFGSGQVMRSEVPLVDFAGASVGARWVDANTDGCPAEQDAGCLAVSLPVQRTVGSAELVIRSRDGDLTRTKMVEVEAAPPILELLQRPPAAGQAPEIQVRASCPINSTALVSVGNDQVTVDLVDGQSPRVELPAAACGPISIQLANYPGASTASDGTLLGQPQQINVIRFGTTPVRCEPAFSVILQDACSQDLNEIAWRPVLGGMGILGAGNDSCQPFTSNYQDAIQISVEPELNTGKFNVRVSARINPDEAASEYASAVVTYGGDGPSFRFDPEQHAAQNGEDCIDGRLVFLNGPDGRDTPLREDVTITVSPRMSDQPMCLMQPTTPIVVPAGTSDIRLYGKGEGAANFIVTVYDSQGTTEKLWPISYATTVDAMPRFTTNQVTAGCSAVELSMAEATMFHDVETRFGMLGDTHDVGDGLFVDNECSEPVGASIRVQDRKTLYMFHRTTGSQMVGARTLGTNLWYDTTVTVTPAEGTLQIVGPAELEPNSGCHTYNVVVADAFGNAHPAGTASNETFNVAASRRDTLGLGQVQVSANCSSTPLGAPISLGPQPGARSFGVWASTERGYFVLGASSLDSMLVGRKRLRVVTNCGNGVIDVNEQCDTGAGREGTGCSDCDIDEGFLCYGEPSRCADVDDTIFVVPTGSNCPSDATCVPNLEMASADVADDCEIFVTESVAISAPVAPGLCDNNGGRVRLTAASGVTISGSGPLIRPYNDSRLTVVGGIWNSDGGAATVEVASNAWLDMNDVVIAGRADVGVAASGSSHVTLERARIIRHPQAGLRSSATSRVELRNVVVQGGAVGLGLGSGLELGSSRLGTAEHVTILNYGTPFSCQNTHTILASAIEHSGVLPSSCTVAASCTGADLGLDALGRLQYGSACRDTVGVGTTTLQTDIQLQPRPLAGNAMNVLPIDAGADEFW